jgi:enterochelin esterase-like enzyme
MLEQAWSPTLGEHIRYAVRMPAWCPVGGRYQVAYLLHGRDADPAAWPPLDLGGAIAVLPDAPWSDRASWYVDSRHRDGRPVESAFVRDLVPAIDAALPTVAGREGRIVGGVSMGGAGALRLALAHPGLFGGALLLSPAVYADLPPARSNTRNFGAYGLGDSLFDDDVYRELSYPALLAGVDPARPLRVFIGVGADEEPLAAEAQRLYDALRATAGIEAELRIYNGGHEWGTWGPAFADGRHYLELG